MNTESLASSFWYDYFAIWKLTNGVGMYRSQTSSLHLQKSEAGENSIEPMIELLDASELLKSLEAPAI